MGCKGLRHTMRPPTEPSIGKSTLAAAPLPWTYDRGAFGSASILLTIHQRCGDPSGNRTRNLRVRCSILMAYIGKSTTSPLPRKVEMFFFVVGGPDDPVPVPMGCALETFRNRENTPDLGLGATVHPSENCIGSEMPGARPR
jgi:hypothetical protein